MSILLEGMPGGILGFLIALVPLIIVHEIGHMLVAKKVGVWVKEFGIGYPPRIGKLFKWQETDFTLNWLPLGGFVRLEGENVFEQGNAEKQEPSEQLTEAEQAKKAEIERHSLYAQPPGKRILIYLGGPTMNLLMAWGLAVVLFLTGIPGAKVGIQEIVPNSPAESAALQVNDVITAVNGQPIETLENLMEQTDANLGEPVRVTVQRDDTTLEVTLTPRKTPPEGQGPMGIVIGYQEVKRYPLGESILMATQQIAYMIGATFLIPVYIIRGLIPLGVARPVGIVGISRLAQTSIQQSVAVGALYPLLQNIILISLSLGIFNLLPIPALDGGRILFSVIEKIRSHPLTPETEERIHMIALAIMIVLFVFVTVLDIFVPIVP